MTKLSTIAETIADYAISIAKRNENEQAGEVHLLAAVRRWQTERFESRFPGGSERLSNVLQSMKGTSLRVNGLDEAAIKRLEAVSVADDVWSMADQLMLAVDRAEVSSDATGNRANSPGSQADQHGFPLTESLIERVNGLTGGDLADTASRILDDALAVSIWVLGSEPDGLRQRVVESVDVAGASLSGSTTLSNLVGDVARLDSPDSGKAATQLALALVEVAQWAAVMDNTVTEEETDRIDEVRLELRRQLGDRLNAESPAVAEFERKFAHLVGMQSVKAELRKRVDYLVVSKRRERQGHKTEGHRMHLAFVGNPGTGKTTVARLYGELLNDLGLLPTRSFVETDRSGLVAEYVGQTEPKVLKVIESAAGGVLFIDEVYALQDNYGNGQKGFGEEATDVLVKQMEDRREHLVVVIAGYRKQTLRFLEMNPGLRSRVPLVVDFPDYSRGELLAICHRVAERSELTLAEGAAEKMATLLDQDRTTDGFGNARAVENLLQAAHRNAVSRASTLGNLATEDESSQPCWKSMCRIR